MAPAASSRPSRASRGPSGCTYTCLISVPRSASGGSEVIVASRPPYLTAPSARAAPPGTAFTARSAPGPPVSSRTWLATRVTGGRGRAGMLPRRPGSGSAPGSCLRELMPSLTYTLRRCHSTVRGLMESWVLISGLDSPSRASPAICASCAVSSSRSAARAWAQIRPPPAGHRQLPGGELPCGKGRSADRSHPGRVTPAPPRHPPRHQAPAAVTRTLSASIGRRSCGTISAPRWSQVAPPPQAVPRGQCRLPRSGPVDPNVDPEHRTPRTTPRTGPEGSGLDGVRCPGRTVGVSRRRL